MADQILVPESVVSHFEERARCRDKVATQTMYQCGLTAAVFLIGYVVLALTTGFEFGEPNSAQRALAIVTLLVGTVALGSVIPIWPIYRMRRKAREAIQMIETIRARGPVRIAPAPGETNHEDV